MFILIYLHRYTCKRMCEYTDLERDVYICVFMYISMVIQTSLCDNCLNLKLNGFSPTVGHYLMTFELWLKFRCIAVFFSLLTCGRVRNFFARLPWNALCLKPLQTWKESEARLNRSDVISNWLHLKTTGNCIYNICHKMVESHPKCKQTRNQKITSRQR